MAQMKLIAGEDATLLYLYECEECGAIILYDYSSIESTLSVSDLCPNCETYKTGFPTKYKCYVEYWTKAEIAKSALLQYWLKVCVDTQIVIFYRTRKDRSRERI